MIKILKGKPIYNSSSKIPGPEEFKNAVVLWILKGNTVICHMHPNMLTGLGAKMHIDVSSVKYMSIHVNLDI
jgi:hypothetical protein